MKFKTKKMTLENGDIYSIKFPIIKPSLKRQKYAQALETLGKPWYTTKCKICFNKYTKKVTLKFGKTTIQKKEERAIDKSSEYSVFTMLILLFVIFPSTSMLIKSGYEQISLILIALIIIFICSYISWYTFGMKCCFMRHTLTETEYAEFRKINSEFLRQQIEEEEIVIEAKRKAKIAKAKTAIAKINKSLTLDAD